MIYRHDSRILISMLLASLPAFAGTPTDFEVVPSTGHHRQVERLAYSPDGRWLVSSSDGYESTTRVWLDSRLRHVLPGSLATLSPDGATVVTAVEPIPGWTGVVRHFRVATGELLWETPSAAATDLAVTADGTRVVVAGLDGAARVFDLRSGGLERVIEDRAFRLRKLALTSDGSLVASGGHKNIWLWEVATGAERCRLEGHTTVISALAFARDDAYLASADHHGVVRVWDPKTCDAKAVLQADAPRFDDLALSPDAKYLVAGGQGGAAQWDVDSGELIQSLDIPGKWVTAVAADPGGRWFAIGQSCGAISLMTPGVERPIRTLHSDFGLKTLTPSPDGHELAAGHFGIDLIPITLSGGKTVLPNFKQHVDGLALSHDSAQLVTQSDGRIRIWDLAADRPPIELTGSRALASADGAVVAVGSRERGDDVRLWHRDSRRIRAEARHDAVITSFALDRRGTMLATGAADGTVRLWDARTGELRGELAGPSSVVHDIALIEDGRAVVASYPDGSLWVWDIATSTPRHVLNHPARQRAQNLLAVPSSSLLVSHVSNGGAYLWDLARGEMKRPLTEKNKPVGAAAFSPGRIALALNFEQAPALWDTKTGQVVTKLEGHRAPVDAIAIFDQGRRLVAGARDGILGWWDYRGRLRRLQPTSRSGVTSLAVSSVGDLLLIGDRDGAVSVRRTEGGEEIVRLLSSPRGGWAVVTPDGRWDAPSEGHGAGFTVWSRRRHGPLTDHLDRQAPGLLARVLKPHVEAGRDAPPPAEPEVPMAAPAASAAVTAAATPVPRPPSLRDLEPSPRGTLRPATVDFFARDRGALMAADGHQVALRLPRCCGDTESELRISDLSDPARPKLLKQMKLSENIYRIDLVAGYVYLTAPDELIVVDARQPENAREVGRVAIDAITALDAAGGKVYVGTAFDGLKIVDIDRLDQASPLTGKSDVDDLGSLNAIVAVGSLLYAATSDSLTSTADSFLQVVDVSDPAAPFVVGRSIYATGNRRVVRGFAVEGSHAYLAAEDLGLLIFDLEHPGTPRQVARVDTPSLFDVAVSGYRAYLADLYLGLQILDVSTPAEPRFWGGDERAPEAGYGPDGVVIAGERLLVSSYREGVKIVRVQ